jgi:hypothetical protein
MEMNKLYNFLILIFYIPVSITAQDYYQYNALDLKKHDEKKFLQIYRNDSIFCLIDFNDNVFRLEITPITQPGTCLHNSMVRSNKYIEIGKKRIPVVTFIDEQFLSYDQCDFSMGIHYRNPRSTFIEIRYPISFPLKYEISWPSKK